MKNKKGFTLIELLAVIVILAIIMVIAVPKILDLIEESRQNASNTSIKLVKDAIKTQIAASQTLGSSNFTETDGCYEFDFDNKNSNYNNLNVKNKENIIGSIKYCNNIFEDDSLATSNSSASSTNESLSNKVVIYSNGEQPSSIKLNDEITWPVGNKAYDDGSVLVCETAPNSNEFGRFYTDEIDFSNYSTINIISNNNDITRMEIGTNFKNTNSEVIYNNFSNATVTYLGDSKNLITLDLSELTEEQKVASFSFCCYSSWSKRRISEIYLER